MRTQFVLQAGSGAGSDRRGLGHADLDAGASDADGADEQVHAVLMPSEHILNRRAHGRPLRIGPNGQKSQGCPAITASAKSQKQ